MPRLRLIPVIVGIVLLVAIVLVWTLLRPPTITRLLPESDAIFFADLRPLRLATRLDQQLPPRSADYQSFVDQTGIVPERDLDQAAFAITPRPDSAGPNGPVAWTELLAGHFDGPRLEGYLRSLQPATEVYAGHTLFVIPIQPSPDAAPSRVLRVTVVRPGLLALSNAPTPEQIHLILDHSRFPLFSPVPSVLANHFARIPHLSLAWGVGRTGLPFAESGHLSVLGLELPVPADQPMIASLRYLGGLQLRVEALTPSPDIALQESGAISSLLSVARILASAQPGNSPSPLLTAVNSVHVTPEDSRAILTATIPLELLRNLAAIKPSP